MRTLLRLCCVVVISVAVCHASATEYVFPIDREARTAELTWRTDGHFLTLTAQGQVIISHGAPAAYGGYLGGIDGFDRMQKRIQEVNGLNGCSFFLMPSVSFIRQQLISMGFQESCVTAPISTIGDTYIYCFYTRPI